MAVSVGTSNATPLLGPPATVTTTYPVVATLGTEVTIVVALQLNTVAAVLLNVTVLLPCVAPKLLPVIVTLVPGMPTATERLVMVGGGATVKLLPLLFTPLARTTTFPVVAPTGTDTLMRVALQLVGVPTVPLNETLPPP
jgi:hypothetical protein